MRLKNSPGLLHCVSGARACAAGNMSGSEAVRRAPYADDAPRELTDADLSFLSDYTGERDLAALRQHVLRVWNDVKAKARCSGARSLCPCAEAC